MPSFGVRVYKEYLNFACSHFLIFSDGTREPLHGHNYQVRVELRGGIGAGDMVLDLCRLKPIVKQACDELDHRLLLPGRNPRLEVVEGEEVCEARYLPPGGQAERFVVPRKDVRVLPIANTSTERLAEYLGARLRAPVLAAAAGTPLETLTVEVEEAGGQCGLYQLELAGGR
ncbi:MAG: 6-pyruvoyl tetrahydropterin synthase [Planctomycetota bacterium]|nr:MAG: 6-pyruvoyl tetrahydropterin synthase [Planctomycetota bacterium]